MFRTRILAAATATVLMLGMSVGGAGAAFADDAPTGETPIVEGAVVEEAALEESPTEDLTEPAPSVQSEDSGEPVVAAGQPDDAGLKVFVCKYVGTPGIDEEYQTGQNPISVDYKEGMVIGTYFVDGQGRSYILEFDETTGGGQEGEPSIEDCPPPDGGPEEVTPSASVDQLECVEDEIIGGVITVDLTKMGVDYTIEDSEGDPVSFDPSTGETGMLEPGDYTVFGVDADSEDAYDVSDYEELFTIDEYTEDCGELDAVVVPEVTSIDECVDELELDIAAAAGGIASFTVTASPNVSYTYTVNGGSPIDVVFPDGEETVTIVVAPGDLVVVTATAADGFTLPEGYEPWSKEFINSEFCPGTFPTTDAAASFVLPDCLGNPGRVILTNGLGVIWTLDGDVVAGNSSYEVSAGSEVELSAGLEGPSEEFPGGFGWNDAEQQTEWTQAFPAAEDCGELETLAFTGAGAFTNWLGVAAVLMMAAGMGFVVRRNRIEV